MLNHRFFFLWTLLAVLSASCGSSSQDHPASTKAVAYRNPVVRASMPDPTVIRAHDGYFYVYATEDTRNVPIMKSKDLAEWTYAGRAFTEEGRPSFVTGGGIWAPDINFIDGQYVLYYAMSVWGGEMTCGIGVAVSPAPAGPFADQGKLFTSDEIGVRNSIDPCYVETDDGKFLVWGSFHGIYAAPLSEDGLSLAPGAVEDKVRLAGTAFEAPCLEKHGDFYYLFASVGSCCAGINSTYRTVVGRSSSIWGPYVDKEGVSMVDNGYTVLIGPNEAFVGNGHNAGIVRDDAGQDWILYHGIDTGHPDGGRYLLLDPVQWDVEGWPYIEGGSPSTAARPLPVFTAR
ncbi:MAG: family 43 glycosylhydrolase [Bacteroidales bacterium]|nr:family 43 glycosylhydrolase [Bacteroidales bacterium]